MSSKSLGEPQIKGVEAPLHVYEVLGAGPYGPPAGRHPAGADALCRTYERIGADAQALAHAKAGHGQTVGVMGEPGLGKSRLFYEFKLYFSEWVSHP